MTDYKFSKRIETIAKYIKKGTTVADIGTDHGYLPLYLLLNDYGTDIIAADVRKEPLEKAKRNAKAAGVSDKIRFCLSDGLDNITDDADTYVICGMGGYVILHILEKAIADKKIKQEKEFILSPHSDEKVLREFLYKNGFRIEDEEMIRDKDFFYVIIHCVYDGIRREADELTYYYGEQPLYQMQPAMEEFLTREKRILCEVADKLKKLDSENATVKLKEIEYRLIMNSAAMDLLR